MKKSIATLLLLMLFCSSTLSQQIQPTPQEQSIKEGVFKIAKKLQIVNSKETPKDLLKKLETIFGDRIQDKGYRIYIGTKGDKSIKDFEKRIPNHSEGYYLSIDKKRIVIAGFDNRGLAYGIQSLSQLLVSDSLPLIEVSDWPDVAYRGVVEGFYGTPWSFEARLSQIKFYGENKMNTYMYGPKDDPYHSSPHWRSPYPEKEAQYIKELANCAKENNVNFVWAIHPGKDIQWNPADRDKLTHKFEKMYDLGVRSFAVFFDDISGEGTKADKQAELLNHINREFIHKKPDVLPLIMCPTEYNKSWANVEGGYLTTLGKQLDKDIHIMWTGDRVCIDIHQESLEWINPLIERPAFIWWNFPVSDYVRNHLLMGKVYGNDTNIAPLLSGFVCNPMEHAEASKIAIYGVASYTWNMKKYDSDIAWNDAIGKLMPTKSEALKKFAQHNSDLGMNGHRYRREESVHILPTLETAIKSLEEKQNINSDIVEQLKGEFSAITTAANQLLDSKENEALMNEINPWVLQFRNTGELGQATIALYKSILQQNKALFIENYEIVRTLYKESYQIDQTYNQNPYQPGVKTASLHIQPFIDLLFKYSVNKYNDFYDENIDSTTSYSPFKLETTVGQLQHVPLQTKLKQVSIPPINEIITWKKGEYITIEALDSSCFTTVQFIAKADGAEWLLETSKDGKEWSVSLKPFELGKPFDFHDTGIKLIRIKNRGKETKLQFKRLDIQFK